MARKIEGELEVEAQFKEIEARLAGRERVTNSGRVTTMSENKRAEELDLGRIAHTDLAKKNLSSGVMPLRPRPEKAGNPDQ